MGQSKFGVKVSIEKESFSFMQGEYSILEYPWKAASMSKRQVDHKLGIKFIGPRTVEVSDPAIPTVTPARMRKLTHN